MIQGEVANAMIENIKEYGKLKEFKELYKKDHVTKEFINENAKISDNSFKHMIKKNPKFYMYTDENTKKIFSLKEEDKFSVILARHEGESVYFKLNFKINIFKIFIYSYERRKAYCQ